MRLRRFRRQPTFTAHNFELGDGGQTLPGEPLIGEEPISISYLRTLRIFCPPPARVADLGCLEGGYAVHLARAGYDVLGIEGQAENFRTCEWVGEQVSLPNLRFVRDERPQHRRPRRVRRRPLRRAPLPPRCAGLLPQPAGEGH